MASTSLSSVCSLSSAVTSAKNRSSCASMLLMCTRRVPSTSTLTVPSGSLSNCRMLATQPTLYNCSGAGSSSAADFWATSTTDLLASMASSSALIDLGRPTNSGITICGKTTTSRSGSIGRRACSPGCSTTGFTCTSCSGACSSSGISI